MRFLQLTLALVFLHSVPLWSQDAVVSYNVNLRADPSSANPEMRLLLPGEELFLVSPDKTNNYYHVRTMAGEQGWAYGPRIRASEKSSV